MPTIGDLYTKDIEIKGMPKHVEIDDTAGQEAYADLKKEKMSTGDVSRLTAVRSTHGFYVILSFLRALLVCCQRAPDPFLPLHPLLFPPPPRRAIC